ncbi:pantothenate kinase [Alkalihalobacillus alcalophilus ATCC 27647 = CGMCC 1.3604]|uniref:Type III pantothenate kinase n=1 Tax=Alkalihalobacillus alcalophilus ATCC 27647 = CGMCC 1.3604 TaxID=1218173 RepID=A0A094WF04_ALKAL|nr:type III pantothenate kinase [Alkalihalobacillus alcalophilus]KGA96324.1 pantothenate kinase [Alkalihalobacillus alcalophilus ATCC 27647 = CGMCC 1.3604]MED1561722.1 type III pantothenate kinase [Alkalihalobacillus alcalophilus]THG92393.1 pantothenate kinase [Alkalihalobacillus alcalophilus ATCC 27647 = CGMCC 1.3604]
MILVMDIGNSNIGLGVYRQDKLVFNWRMATNRQKTEDEYAVTLKSLFNEAEMTFRDVEGIIIASVVPPIMYTMQQMCKKYFALEPLIIGPGIKTGLNIKYDNPKEVGADRIVNAVAAIEKYGSPLIIVDFGTATTYCFINEHNQYIGGAIAPGISISTEALFSKAAKLPRIEISKPPHILGKNTVHAMQSGIFYGYVGQVDGIVNRIKAESESVPKVIATGGLAELISEQSESIDIVDKYLTLSGLHKIYKKNTK